MRIEGWGKENVLRNNAQEISRIDERHIFLTLDSQRGCK